MSLVIGVIFFIFGSLIGSFLNVVILRLPKEQTLSGRSMCVNCRHTLKFYDLVPVFSYAFLGGKCRYCKKKISPRYFIIEITTALAFAFIAINLSSGVQIDPVLMLKLLSATALLIVIFVIDLEHFLILDKILVIGSAIILLSNLILDFTGRISLLSLHSNFVGGIFASLVASGFFFLLWFISKGTWMGFGDVKFALLLGFIVGWPNILVLLMLAFCLGTLVSIPLLLMQKKHLKSPLPFGTFLSVACFITMLYGPDLVNWYASLIGLR